MAGVLIRIDKEAAEMLKKVAGKEKGDRKQTASEAIKWYCRKYYARRLK